jgi:hypothetical protein
VTCTEAFDEIADLTGYSWNIDYRKGLRFFDRTENAAPAILDDAYWTDYRQLTVTEDQDKYRNLQYLRGGEDTTQSTLTDSFLGDGKTRTFTLRMPVSKDLKPVLEVNDTPVAPAEIDIRRDEASQTGIKWFYGVGEKQISQASGETELTSSQTLDVVYKGMYPIIVLARDEAEIDYRATLENTSGVYMHSETDDRIDDEDMAWERVSGWLRRYARTATKVSFRTRLDGFASGQMLVVNRPEYDISGDFLITSVQFSAVGSTEFDYQVEAIKGEGEGGWVEFWRKLAAKLGPQNLRENDLLLLFAGAHSGMVIGDAANVGGFINNYLFDPYSVMQFSTSWETNASAFAIVRGDGSIDGPRIGLPYQP